MRGEPAPQISFFENSAVNAYSCEDLPFEQPQFLQTNRQLPPDGVNGATPGTLAPLQRAADSFRRSADTTAITEAMHPNQKPNRFLTCSFNNHSASGDRANPIPAFGMTVMKHQPPSTNQ